MSVKFSKIKINLMKIKLKLKINFKIFSINHTVILLFKINF